MTACRLIASPFYRLMFGGSVKGRSPVRSECNQALIIVSNHHSKHDPLHIITTYHQDIKFLAKDELFHGLFGWFFRWLGLIDVKRGQPGGELDVAIKALTNGHKIAIFPEGTTRYKTARQLLPFKHGAIKLAQQSGYPIQPLAIVRPAKSRRPVMVFGELIYVQPADDIDQKSIELQKTIAGLMEAANGQPIDCIAGKPAKNPSQTPPAELR